MGPDGGEAVAVVVGAGPGGSAAALLLAATGRRVTLLEREAGVGAPGAGILLQPNGLAVLDAIGVGAELRARGSAIRSARVYDGRGEVLADMPVPDFGPGLDHALVVRRSVLAEVLDEQVRADPGVDVLHGATVVGATATGLVSYRQHGIDHRRTTALLVGADGIGSRVRRSIGFGAKPVGRGHRYARMIVRAELDRPAGECWTRLGLFGWAPLGDGWTYAFASLDDADSFADVWAEELPFVRPLLDALDGPDDLLVNEVGTVRCASFVADRCAVIGDAAHAMAPNLGQGANSALLDAAVLALELHGRSDQSAGLAAYDRERRRAVRPVQRTADRLARAAHLQGTATRALRDRLTRAASRPSLADRQVRSVQQVDPAEVRDRIRAIRT